LLHLEPYSTGNLDISCGFLQVSINFLGDSVNGEPCRLSMETRAHAGRFAGRVLDQVRHFVTGIPTRHSIAWFESSGIQRENASGFNVCNLLGLKREDASGCNACTGEFPKG
jgi:hypothetical protein